jgi:hypothetical protein
MEQHAQEFIFVTGNKERLRITEDGRFIVNGVHDKTDDAHVLYDLLCEFYIDALDE